MTGRREEGIQGEEQATKTLRNMGYRIIEKNYRSPFGELDIIAEEGSYLVFIEVKKRNTRAFGGPLDAINAVKKKRIVKTALFYMKTHKCLDRKVRFDVVGIDRENIKIVKHAFILEE